MVDIQAMQASFLINWDKTLLRQEQAEWKVIQRSVYKMVVGMSIFHSNIKLREFKGTDLIQSRFWKRVLQVWIDYSGVEREKYNSLYVRFNFEQ